jgi:transposase
MIDPHPPGTEPAPTAGIDWASAEHAVAVVDGGGVQLQRFTVAHTTPGLRDLVRRLRRAGVLEVAIERGDGPVVDALLDADLVVIVVAPNRLKNLRSRYGSAGNKDDGFDAYVLADTLRTDRARLRPLTRDSDATTTLRMAVRARQDLVAARVAMGNQLRAHLQTTFPGAIGLFRDIDSPITLRFLTASPPRTRPTGCPRPGSRTGCDRSGTTTWPSSMTCGSTCTTHPAAPPATKPHPGPGSRWPWWPR